MTYSVSIRAHREGPILFQRTFDNPDDYGKELQFFAIKSDTSGSKAKTGDELQTYTPGCRSFNSKAKCGFLKCVFMPIRTNNLENFCKDFFLPAIFSMALKVHGLADMIFVCIFCFPIDIMTLPLRIITFIPRIYINSLQPKEKHPLYLHLLEQGVDKGLLKADYVYFTTTWTCIEKYFEVSDFYHFIDVPDGLYYASSSQSYFGGPPNNAQLKMLGLPEKPPIIELIG